MKQYNLSKAIDKGRLLSKIYAELLKLREIIRIDSDPGFRPNVRDLSLCRCQSSHQDRRKSTDHCTTDSRRYRKMSSLVMFKKVEK